uniref:homeobox protein LUMINIDEPENDENS n=1 Tax=Erigeron canadensis TaxID=72917 RepID=UPI001CB8CFF3|nr:homeobox protein LUMINIDEPENDENS [Erigeron canadensis]
MAISNQLALVVSSSSNDKNTTSYEQLLDSQKDLISKQIYDLQNIVSTQCKLTGVNPLSQEMAAGALSIKIGKRPRDLLNPKAIKYMQAIFSVKDEISKKETRAISALFGLTATQVRDFFNGQRTKVRRFIRLSREKALESVESVQKQAEPLNSSVEIPNQPVPLNSIGPSNVEEPSCSMQDEVLADTNDSDKYFISNIFHLLRKEETFSGQVKLMEWILQIQNASVLFWFMTNGGVMILASWLSQAAIEEQTSVLHVILRVLCHLPLHKALPAHMSAILQSVNKLRFYRGSDISKRAKTLLSRWSKMFARSQALRKTNANISPVDAQDEMLLKQSIGEIMENESLEARIDNPGAIYLLQENSENSRSQSMKLLTAPSDDSNTKLLRGVSSSHTRERRKVQLVEQPGQKAATRGPQVTRVVSAPQGRPLSADDIQKAKMRAQFMRSKYGESYVNPQVKTEVSRPKALVHPKVEEPANSSSMTPLAAKVHDQPLADVHPKVEEPFTSSIAPLAAKVHVQPLSHVHAPVAGEHVNSASMTSLSAIVHVQPTVDEHMGSMKVMSGDEVQEVPFHRKETMLSEEPVWKKCKRLPISWVIPPEMKIIKEWSVCCGENSKEVDVQNNRIKREKEVFYNTILEIPPNPKEPWDQEMDYDDSLTPVIPIEQLPDDDDNMIAEPTEVAPEHTNNYAAGTSTITENNYRNAAEPDLELLAVLLKNPQIVFALTAGQGGNLSNEQMVQLLDAIKVNAAQGGSIGSLVDGLVERKAEKVEVSLPSPTPSSEPVTSGWRSESAKTQFSGQSVTVNGDIYAIPGVHFQETSLLTPATTVTSLGQQAISSTTQQRFPDLVPEQRYISDLVPEQRNIPATVNGLQFQANLTQQEIHQRFSDLVPEQRNIPAADNGFTLQGGYASSNASYMAGHGTSQLQPQVSPVQSWTIRDSLGSSPYTQTEQSINYGVYGTREFAQPVSSRSGVSRVRNGQYRDETAYESWSPENSPFRSNQYVDGWDYSDPQGQNYNYRPEMSRMQNDTSRYRDRGTRNDGSRWRDRRR